MNSNLRKFLGRLDNTEVPTTEGQLRDVTEDGTVCMCPLGHLVDIWINDNPGAHWDMTNPTTYRHPEKGLLGFPTDEMLEEFELSPRRAYQIYRQNDVFHKTPAEVAKFIREELI